MTWPPRSKNRPASKVLDYRTRLLIRDSLEALKDYWGDKRFDTLAGALSRLATDWKAIWREDFERPGFPLIGETTHGKDATRSHSRDLLRELGNTHPPTASGERWRLGCADPVRAMLSRHTEDIDVVDEVPAEIREQYALLDELEAALRSAVAHLRLALFAQRAGRIACTFSVDLETCEFTWLMCMTSS